MNFIEKIKESVGILLETYGTVSFPYKENIDDWLSKVEIYYVESHYSDPHYVIHGGPFHGEYKTKEKAINKFVECIFNENNIAILLPRIKKKYNIKDFDDLDEDELKKLIEEEKILYKQAIRKEKINNIESNER